MLEEVWGEKYIDNHVMHATLNETQDNVRA